MSTVQRFGPLLLGVSLAGGLAFLLFGFTVDDALISARYASNIHEGLGHRFNPSGPVTDGVTPLFWPYLLAPFSSPGPLAALGAGMVLGLLFWLGSAVLLSRHLGQILGPRVGVGWLAFLVAFCTPAVGAWAGSGMETGVATGLVTVAVVLMTQSRWRWLSSLLLGLSCTFRPELLPFSLTLALGSAWLGGRESKRREGELPVSVLVLLAHLLLASIPFFLVSLIRWWVFGSFAPLSLQAKPSDLTHGLMYVAATCLVAGPVLAVVAPFAWRRLPCSAKWLLAAFLAHAAGCTLAGGDWMPMSRLFVPVLPSLSIVFAHLSVVGTRWSCLLRAILCLLGQGFVFFGVGIDARHVVQDRLRLIEAVEGRLDVGSVVGSLDIGWVGAGHRGSVLDMAGVTDPVIAALPGGHTSKRIPPEYVEGRGVTYLLLLLPQKPGDFSEEAWEQCNFARAVEVGVCTTPRIHEAFVPDRLVFSTDRLVYLLLRRSEGR